MSASEPQQSNAAEATDALEDSADTAQPADFQELEQSQQPQTTEAPKDVDLNVILDVDVTLGLEVGRTALSVRELLQLNQGSVVELDRLAGEPLDVLVNGTLVAHGDVVVVNNNYGIRLTDVVSPSERIRKVNE